MNERFNKINGFHAVTSTLKMAYKLEKTFIILSAVLALMDAVTPYIAIFLSARIIDGLVAGEEFTSLLTITATGLGIIFLSQILERHISKKREIHQSTAFHNYQMEYTKKMIEMDYAQLEAPLTTDILNRIKADNVWGSGFYGIYWSLSRAFLSFAGFIIAAGVSIPLFISGDFFTGYVTPTAFIVLLVLSIVTSIITEKHITKIESNIMNEPHPDKSHLFYFIWGGIDYKAGKDVRIYNTGEIIQDYMDRGDKWWKSWTRRLSNLRGKRAVIVNISSSTIQCGIYALVVIRAIAGALTIGDVVIYVAAIMNFINGVSSIMGATSMLSEYAKRQMSTLEYLNIPNILSRGTLTTEKRGDNEYEIEFKNVSFKYPGKDVYALKNINLKFNIGQRMAVVGMNGSGKTTMIKLLCRLYDPTEGEITLNGIDIKSYDYNEYMAIFSVVFQDFKLFSFTLAQNVAASVNVDENKAQECLAMAGLDERLKNMPKGLETSLYKDFEENGVGISGGEAQKIAIARALYKDAPFIVLDEPTAALDPIAEFEIYSKFNEIVEDKTAIYISHRLSSCRFCDDIAVFHEGELIQRGSHDALIADENGKYYELWTAQAQYYSTNHESENINISIEV